VPTYEYACESCGKRYEKREGFDAPARQKCQHCGKTVNRVLFAPPIVFKGSGFYKTDSRGTSSASTDSGPGSSSGNGHGHPHGPDGSHVDSTDSGTTETAAAT
jgi:putative FmdB family regulatory protein